MITGIHRQLKKKQLEKITYVVNKCFTWPTGQFSSNQKAGAAATLLSANTPPPMLHKSNSKNKPLEANLLILVRATSMDPLRSLGALKTTTSLSETSRGQWMLNTCAILSKGKQIPCIFFQWSNLRKSLSIVFIQFWWIDMTGNINNATNLLPLEDLIDCECLI